MPAKNYLRRRWLGSAALIFTVAIFFGAMMARKNYEARLRQQIWPVSVPEIVAASQPVTGKIPTVLLLGDSRMAQWGLPEIKNWRVVNGAFFGLTTGQIAASAPRLLDDFHPDAVVIEAGINDLKFIGLRPDMAGEIISLAMSNFTAVATECSRRHCALIILQTWPAGAPSLARRFVWNHRIPEAVTEFNRRLEQMNSREQKISVLDLLAQAGIKPGPENYTDTLHFRSETYQLLTPALAKSLAAILPRDDK